MKYKVIILDFDGTLIESNDIKNNAFKYTFGAYPDKLQSIMAYHFANISLIRFEKFKFITESILGQVYDKNKENELAEKFSQYVLNRSIECPFVKGALEFLKYFKNSISLYLISVNPAFDLDKILESRDLKRYFKAIYPVKGFKKETIEEILKLENLSPAEALFIGDSLEDLKAAKASMIDFIAREPGKVFIGQSVSVFPDIAKIQEVILK